MRKTTNLKFYVSILMWGYISTEASYQLNFNVGFSTNRSDVLIHLSQWQYWWWFWFSLVWTFYYLITSRVVRFRVLKMRPKIVTSYRPHGKWGDFLACIIPLIWCINILTNSNFILRLIEWQNESSLFTVRVRARQWYWIYKFELKNFTDILTAPKNVGTNKWIVSTFGDLQTADDYLHILQLRSQNRWVKKYWNATLKNSAKVNKYHIVSPQEQFKLDYANNFNNIDKSNNVLNLSNSLFLNSNLKFITNTDVKSTFLSGEDIYNNILSKKFKNLDIRNASEWSDFFFSGSNNKFTYNLQNFVSSKNLFYNSTTITNLLSENFYSNETTNTLYYHNDFVENSRHFKRSNGVNKPLRLIKLPILFDEKLVDDLKNKNELNLFRVRLNTENLKIANKEYSNNPYLTLKQKKYSRKKSIQPITRSIKVDNNDVITKVRKGIKPVLINNAYFEENNFDSTIQYNLIRKNKTRNDLIPVTLARRLLRTKKTLVLPAHINITLITNSYDIIHSWFIPGLGIKLDCVPGRSTHHTFYIDNVGFYYGQCAEICGRFHHHMPIRVCALPFEHFLIWWHTFGLPKLLFTTSQRKLESVYAFRKYVW